MKKARLVVLLLGVSTCVVALFSATPMLENRVLHSLCKAAFRGDSGTVKICLMTRPDLNKCPIDWNGLKGFRALECAAIGGNAETVMLLLQNGGNPNLPGPSPLIAACHRGEFEIVKLLLEHGANPNANGNRYGDGTPLSAAMDRPEVIQLLLSYGAKE